MPECYLPWMHLTTHERMNGRSSEKEWWWKQWGRERERGSWKEKERGKGEEREGRMLQLEEDEAE